MDMRKHSNSEILGGEILRWDTKRYALAVTHCHHELYICSGQAHEHDRREGR